MSSKYLLNNSLAETKTDTVVEDIQLFEELERYQISELYEILHSQNVTKEILWQLDDESLDNLDMTVGYRFRLEQAKLARYLSGRKGTCTGQQM